MTDEPVALPAAPRARDELDKTSWTQSVLPMLGALGFVGFIVISPRPVFILVGMLWMLAMVGSAVGLAWDRRQRDKRRTARDRRQYGEHLRMAALKLSRAADAQRESSRRHDPAPKDLCFVACTPSRLWERRPHHSDFLQVRWGVGDSPLRVSVRVPDTTSVLVDPVCQYEMEQVASAGRVLRDAPLHLNLRDYGWSIVGGDPARARGVARAVVGQVASWHGPDDVRLLVACEPARLKEWEWARWLPHVRWCETELSDGSLVITTPNPVVAAMADLAARRDASIPSSSGLRLSRDQPVRRAGPHLLVVLDGIDFGEHAEAVAAMVNPTAGITVIQVVAGDGRWEPTWVSQLLSLDENGKVLRGPSLAGEPSTNATGDDFDIHQAERTARQLARWRLAGTPLTEAAASTSLDQLLGITDIEALTSANAWRPRSTANQLVAPLGTTTAGATVRLDLKESARGGIGPHGLIIGATGSGKSELLRTIVTGLAVTHSPEELAMVLVDFKGGATFRAFERLPHIAGTITNLADDDALIARTQAALSSELQRRQELLSSAGAAVDVEEYRRRQAANPALPVLPTLLVIIDEFSELLAARPEILEVLVAIGRLGRSLGMHLMLASQKLESGKLRGLDSHLSYRIVLRTFNADDSIAALGTRDAHHLPAVPGSAYLRSGTDGLLRFRAACVSVPVGALGTATATDPLLPFHATRSATPPVVDESTTDADGPLLLTHVVERLSDDTRRTHQIWLDPLPTTVTLADVAGRTSRHPQRGLILADWNGCGRYRVPLALADHPEQQRIETVAPDLSGPQGSMLVVGSAQTGKSTFIRQLVLGLALTHAPTETACYIIDLGGGRLSVLNGLPHVGCIATRSDPELTRRTIAQVREVVDERERLFGEDGIAGMDDFRRARREGRYRRHELGDVFLIIDGMAELRRSFDDLDATVADIAARGPGCGVHVVVTTRRVADVRNQLTDHLTTRFELRLNDPIESMFGKRLAAELPSDVPGRALTAGGRLVQLVVPTPLSGAGTDGDATIRDLVASIASAWPGQPAPGIRRLPSTVTVDELPLTQEPGVPVGVSEPRLETLSLELAGAEPHLAVLGDSRSGKSTALATLIEGLVRQNTPDQVQIHVVDYRLGLLDATPSEYLQSFASSSTGASEMAVQVETTLDARQPPKGISASELRARRWWTGPDIYVFVDDYDLVTVGLDNPLLALAPYLPRGHELGLHVIVARKVTGVSRALSDPILGRIREFGNPALILSGDRNEGPLFHDLRASRLPPGRAVLARLHSDPRMVQIAAPSGVRDRSAVGRG